ncbi:MAG: methylmalonyl-CoA mutase family protein, partial [Arenicellales bacterium]|nr:methylmalonyl-CoA mutase family protein [Arenicellales bacterium]
QRGRIQDESLEYEHKKHDGSYPVIGVNTFENPNPEEHQSVELARSTGSEKESQLNRLQDFKKRHQTTGVDASRQLQQTALEGGNVFAALMEAVKHCSLGEITQTLFQVGGQYRRNM